MFNEFGNSILLWWRKDAVVILIFTIIIALKNGSEGRTSDILKVQLPHGGVLVGRHLVTHKGRHMRAFMGIPYAEPPIGDLRFKPPVPFGSWKGERQVTSDGPICMHRDPFRRDQEIEGSEDCLYLNVYTPEEPHTKEPLPVMIWFHGGGWECGSGVSSYYGPDFLMEHDIILVSANFRLGPLGFLSTETLDCPGNFGLKDQLEVLRWVQANVEAFGGNPKSVTIFGESAGGASVTYHMLSPKSKGLFHKGIAQSGTYFNPWAQPAHKGVPAKRARKVSQIVGCGEPSSTSDWPRILECLKGREAKDIVATLYDLFEWDYDPMIPFPPVVEPKHDGAFLNVLPREAPHPHGFELPLMIGATSEEGLLKTAALFGIPELLEDFRTHFKQVLPIILNYDHHSPEVQKYITQEIEAFYLKNGHTFSKEEHKNLTDIISDGWFLAGIDEYLRLRLQANTEKVASTFVYLFQHKGPASFSELFKGGREDYYGACHAEELQYLFPIGRELFISAVPTKNDIELREMMCTLWVNFANSSNPTPIDQSLGVPKWKPAKGYPVDYAHIGFENEHGQWTLLSNEYALLQGRADFWNKLRPHIPANVRTTLKQREDL